MKNMITLPDGTQTWPKYPRRKHDRKEEFARFKIKASNRSRLARGKNRLRYNSLYAADRTKTIEERPATRNPFQRDLDLP